MSRVNNCFNTCTGFRGNLDGHHPLGPQYPEIRGVAFDEPQVVNPVHRFFRATPSPSPSQLPSQYTPASQYSDQYGGQYYQNSQFINQGKKK